ncbi:ABC transporter substrate-binding protein [Agrobacterium rosae]|uniref:ABC transporter substrate-binding protein n=1 Tax=Agrobacterium rosae TaxID=1972867 RepID=A0A1R3TEQ3_9HYPH|nr:ABC transporter substrate-binding protein [Agrobacterium rosae]KAA3515382.1 ABC transporter substrate-binding protein [Agrobacterium rosae]KAA3524349.1 ABC transporter substrate-binding protein [Agrobacterium rosae]MCM2431244.1 ABC transporter substrate-binding protein [Agrobacterium rosae]MDX8302205.1 ABC transporter substrate-binding protein [Agrobacterium rosae]MDX8312734.1 ABC transporter substrate-binding protein [Agrobacterium rosae]
MIISKTFRTAVLATALLGGVSGAALAADLTIGVRAGPLSIDPDFTAAGTHAEAMKHIYDSLIKSGNNLELEPGLATSWTAIDDSTWEFKLRPGVKFHDGSDFTAEDVKFSIERIPRVAGPNPTTIYVRRVKGVEIVDPLTIRVKTDGPAPNLPNDFIRLFVVSHIAAKDYSDSAEKASEGFNSGKAAIGTGPYKFVSWTPKEQLVLERFDGYWGGKEPWDKVIRKELPNDAARVAQLKAGQVDLIARIPASDVPTLEQDSKLTIVRQDSVYLFNIAFDFRDKSPQISAKDGSPLPKNPFTDPKVRQAFDLAIDRETITEIAMEGMGTVQSQLVTPNIFGYNPDVKPTKSDVDKAKALLAEAGYPDGFKVTFSFTNDRLPGDKDAGTTIAQMLTAIGIQVEANAQPGAVYFPANTRGDYSLTMSGWGTLTGEANYTLSSLVHTNEPAKKLGAFNIRGYSNPELDKLIEQAGVEMDAGKREQYLKDANAIVASDRPNLSIASIISAWGMKKAITIVPRSDEDTLAMNIRPAK